jgi:hypothetical protein
MFGSEDPTELYEIFGLFNSLMKLGARSDLSGGTEVTVKGLKALVVPLTGGIGVNLTWDNIGSVITFPSFFSDQHIVTEFFVIRSTDLQFRSFTSWSQAFTVQPDPNDPNDLPEEGLTKVIARVTNDSFISSYNDGDSALEKNTIYYYAIVPRIAVNKVDEVVSDFDAEIVLPLGELSNVVRVEFKRPGDCKAGEPPDWIATESIGQLFPIIEDIIGEVRLLLAWLRSWGFSADNPLEPIIAAIADLVARAEAALAILDEINRRIAALLQVPVLGMAATSFTVPRGGINAWNRELGKRLSDRSDPSRPPFDKNELVAGVVVVAGAPNLDALQSVMTLIELFFGGGSDSNPVLDAIESIDVAVDQLEAVSFGDDLQPDPDAAAPEEPKVVFDESMRPVTDTNC